MIFDSLLGNLGYAYFKQCGQAITSFQLQFNLICMWIKHTEYTFRLNWDIVDLLKHILNMSQS